MHLRTRLLQGALVAASRRTGGKPVDFVREREKGVKLERLFKVARGVSESTSVLGGVPCRQFSSGGSGRGTFLHLHGGAYTGGSSALGRLYSHIAADGGPDVVSVDYRLAPEHPCPAAIDDALAAYCGLLETVPAERVVLGGESAGGGLVLALVQRLIAEDRPLPVAVVPVYPWADLRNTSPSWTANAGRDVLVRTSVEQSSRAYSGALPTDDPRVSPLLGSFDGFPPALVQVGTRDSLLADSRDVTRAMRAAGVSVTLTEYPDVVHGFTLLPVREAKAAMAETRAFVLEHLPPL